MGKCSSLLGLLLGLIAVALAVFTNKSKWYPASDLGDIMQEIFPMTFYVRTLPIAAATMCCLSVACLLKDLTTDKITFRIAAIFGFLAATFCMCVGGGFFIYKMGEITTKIHVKTVEMEEKLEKMEENGQDVSKYNNGTDIGSEKLAVIGREVLIESLWEMMHNKDVPGARENFLGVIENQFGEIVTSFNKINDVTSSVGLDLSSTIDKLAGNLTNDSNEERKASNLTITDIELMHNQTLAEQEEIDEILKTIDQENEIKNGVDPGAASEVESVLSTVLDVPNQIGDTVNEATEFFDLIKDMKFQAGPFIAIASGGFNFMCGMFYACFSCCGLN